jgi:hypothetical protein
MKDTPATRVLIGLCLFPLSGWIFNDSFKAIIKGSIHVGRHSDEVFAANEPFIFWWALAGWLFLGLVFLTFGVMFLYTALRPKKSLTPPPQEASMIGISIRTGIAEGESK